MIPTMLRFRDAAAMRAEAPDAGYVLIAKTAAGEHATFIDDYEILDAVVYGRYKGVTVVSLSVNADWSLHAIAAIELVDAATVEASTAATLRALFAQARGDVPMDDRERRNDGLPF